MPKGLYILGPTGHLSRWTSHIVPSPRDALVPSSPMPAAGQLKSPHVSWINWCIRYILEGNHPNIGCFTGPWIVRLPGVKNKPVKLPFWSILHFFVGKRIFTSHSIALEETIWPYHDTVSHMHHAKCPYLLLMRPTLMVVPWDQKWKRWNQNVLKRVLES